MPRLDLNPYADDPLILHIGEQDWVINPPTAADGAKISVIMTYAQVAAADPSALDQLPAHIRQAAEAIESNDDLFKLALGATYEEMMEAGVPYKIFQTAGRAAAFYWHTGQVEAVHQILEALEGRTPDTPTGVSAPKDSPLPPTGPHTESENPTPTDGTPTTEHLQHTYARSHRANKRKKNKPKRRR